VGFSFVGAVSVIRGIGVGEYILKQWVGGKSLPIDIVGGVWVLLPVPVGS